MRRPARAFANADRDCLERTLPALHAAPERFAQPEPHAARNGLACANADAFTGYASTDDECITCANASANARADHVADA